MKWLKIAVKHYKLPQILEAFEILPAGVSVDEYMRTLFRTRTDAPVTKDEWDMVLDKYKQLSGNSFVPTEDDILYLAAESDRAIQDKEYESAHLGAELVLKYAVEQPTATKVMHILERMSL